MPTFEFKSPEGQSYSVQGPDGATPEQAFGILQQHLGNASAPQGFAANALDFAKSIPRGLATGLSSALSATGKAASSDMLMPDGTPMAETMPTPQQGVSQIEKATGPLPQPQGMAGRFGESVGEALGNPVSYVGPGGLPLKVAGTVLSGLGGQAGEETGLPGGRFVGSIAGGVAGGRVFGPKPPEAAIPTYPELKSGYKQGYKDAIQSGVELKPDALGRFSDYAINHISTSPELSFTERSAPETFAVLNDMRNPPAAKDGVSATITAANINQIKRDLNTIAGKTQPTQTPGVFKSTPDAAAAMVVRDKFNQYLENLPQDHIVAGDPEAYRLALKQANGDFGAAERLRAALGRVDTAQENAAGQIAGSADQQLRGQMRGLLKSGASRSYNPEERSAVQSVNRGNFGSNVLTQLGRGGAGVVPLAAQAAIGIPTAIATGGASIPLQVALAAALYGARKGGEVLTQGRANNLLDTLAKRSPLYQSRVNALPAADTMSIPAQVLRGGLLGIR